MVSEENRDWNLLLTCLMFALQEVPQSSTVFSPFELLYGRQPRGILDPLNEGWEQQFCQEPNVVQFVSQLCGHLRQIAPLLNEHMVKAQQHQKHSYDITSENRSFKPGDKVLVLVPTTESKLYAQWRGLYDIIEAVGPVNYRV